MSMPALTILDTQLVQCTLVACGTLLVYNYLCTLDQEIAYAWSPPWSAGTVLFFLNRYLPFVDTLISIKLKLTMSTPETCQREFTVVTWFIVAGIVISESILVLRTVAIWQARRIVLFVLSISCTVTFIPAIVITQIEIHSLKYIPSDIPGCRLASASSIILVAYILLAVSETTIFVLTIIAAHRSLRHSQAQWVIRLYKDGILFYVFMLGISLANIFVPIFAPRIFANWLATPQRVMHSVLCNRVLLLIFKQRSTNMTNRMQGAANPILESFLDEETSASMVIAGPSALGTVTARTEEIELDTIQEEIR